MWILRIWTNVLMLVTPILSSEHIKTTCEIPSVEAGDNATLTIHFGEDLTHEQLRDFSVVHQDHNARETRLMNCAFSYGKVKCDKTPCCTWESKVTDVFRVYIHNVSQQLEGKFWGFVVPAETEYQKYCSFTLKASTCLTDSINTTNSHVTCINQSVNVGQSCTVTCNPLHYFQENQTSVTYTCVGKNKWAPEMPATTCEVPTCSADTINATNSRLSCNNQSLTIGHTCSVICKPGYYIEESKTFATYTCVGKNKWSPEIHIISCESTSLGLIVLIIVCTFLICVYIALIIIFIVMIYVFCPPKRTKGKITEDQVIPLISENLQVNDDNSASGV